MTDHQALIRHRCERLGLPVPAFELRFHPTRRFRFDAAWEPEKVALEVDGGVWTGGKHGIGSGIVKDQEKTNEAAALGWRVLRCTPRGLEDMAIWDALRRALAPATGPGGWAEVE